MSEELAVYTPPEIENGYWIGARNITESSLWKMRPEDCKIAVYFIAEANHEAMKWYDKYLHKEIIVQRGELIRSVANIAKDNSISYKQTRTSVKHLAEHGFLEIVVNQAYERANAYTHFKVIKYEYYQNPSNYEGERSGRRRADDGQTTGRRRATNKNKKNKKNENNENNSLRLSETQKKRMKVKNNSALMIRIGNWFGRKQDTTWSLYEANTLSDLSPISEDEIIILEEFYQEKYVKDEFKRRSTLETLLNNWLNELDKARKWKSNQYKGRD